MIIENSPKEWNQGNFSDHSKRVFYRDSQYTTEGKEELLILKSSQKVLGSSFEKKGYPFQKIRVLSSKWPFRRWWLLR